MSPELLGWHEKQGLDQTPVMGPTPGSTPPEAEPEQPAPSFQFLRTPASVVKSKHAAESSALGKAVRVKTPAKYAHYSHDHSLDPEPGLIYYSLVTDHSWHRFAAQCTTVPEGKQDENSWPFQLHHVMPFVPPICFLAPHGNMC